MNCTYESKLPVHIVNIIQLLLLIGERISSSGQDTKK